MSLKILNPHVLPLSQVAKRFFSFDGLPQGAYKRRPPGAPVILQQADYSWTILAGVTAGDLRVAGLADETDHQVTECGHDPGACAGLDLGGAEAGGPEDRDRGRDPDRLVLAASLGAGPYCRCAGPAGTR